MHGATIATLVCRPEIAGPLGITALLSEYASLGVDFYINETLNEPAAAGASTSTLLDLVPKLVPKKVRQATEITTDAVGQVSDYMFDEASSNEK
jgi:hypothetical protein